MKTSSFNYLLEVSGGNYNTMIEIIEIFKEQIPEFVNQMKQAIENKDYKMLASIAHKAKSTVSIFDMHDWAEQLKQIQTNIIDNNQLPENIQEIINTFEKNCYDTLKKAIQFAEQYK